MQKTISVKMLAVFMSVILAVGCVIGGTVAWLVAETDEVKNTFTFGDINIILDETKLTPDGELADEDGNELPPGADPVKTTVGNDYKIVPGAEYLKDPAVTVLAESEECWLFVTVGESGTSGVTVDNGEGNVPTVTEYTFDDFVAYEIAEGWNILKDENGSDVFTPEGAAVYYRSVGKNDEDTVIPVLKDNKVTVLESVTKPMIDGIPDEDSNPRLTFTAYAVQYSGFATALDAWKQTS